jgi:multicomponent Na+:H+ antiporter subunit G
MMAFIKEGATIFFALLGAILLLVAGIGLMRMPDLYLRMSAATKAATLGAASLLLAAALHFGQLSLIAQVTATIFFLILTAPVGAHIIARAGYRKNRAPLDSRTTVDELRTYYDTKRQQDAQAE